VRQASRQGDPAAALALHRDADILRAADQDVKHQVSSALWPAAAHRNPRSPKIDRGVPVKAIRNRTPGQHEMDGTHHEDKAQFVLAAPILRRLHAVITIEDVADLADALGK